MHLWFHKSETERMTPATSDNSIILSEAFYDEIDKHPIPVEREVAAMLANAPGVLDLYLWLAWKTWSVNGRTAHIPLLTRGGLADQLGTGEYCADRFFRRKLIHWLAEIKTLWPSCPAGISKDGQSLVLTSSKKTPAVVATAGILSM